VFPSATASGVSDMTSIKRKFFWTGTRNRTRRPASDQRCAGRWLAGKEKNGVIQ